MTKTIALSESSTTTKNGSAWSLFFDQELIDRVKELPGRRWWPEGKCWHLPYSENYFFQLQEHFYGLAEVCMKVQVPQSYIDKRPAGATAPRQSRGIAKEISKGTPTSASPSLTTLIFSIKLFPLRDLVKSIVITFPIKASSPALYNLTWVLIIGTLTSKNAFFIFFLDFPAILFRHLFSYFNSSYSPTTISHMYFSANFTFICYCKSFGYLCLSLPIFSSFLTSFS